MPILFVIVLLSCLFSSCKDDACDKLYNEGLHIIPYPNSIEEKEGQYVFDKSLNICFDQESSKKVLCLFEKRLCNSYFKSIKYSEVENNSDIVLMNDTALQEEEYVIDVDYDKIKIGYSSKKGLYYAMQTFMQLFPAEIEGLIDIDEKISIPCLLIKDKPRFKYRGLLIDVCRHFFTVDELKKQIEIMAMLKLNYLHLHLTDNHGWRLEIDKYPELVKMSSVAETYNGEKYGPYYYTKDEIREIISFAAKNNIQIIPEIEFPGHCMSVLVPFPELSCFDCNYKSEQVFNYSEAVFCVGNEKVYQVMKNILREVADLFPCEYLHIGGDECAKTYWKKCPKCQKLAKDLGLKNTKVHTIEEQLQSYAINKMACFVIDSLNKKMIGWDEILEGGLPEKTVVMSWRGVKGGLTAAEQNHEVIMSSMPDGMYLCDSQGKLEVEPESSGMFSYMKNIYNFDPVPKELQEEKSHYIIGTQCCAWTEWTSGIRNLEYILYPRVIALSETAWTDVEKKDWNNFIKRLDNMLVRFDIKGVNYHIPMPEGVLTNNKIIVGDSVELCFDNSRSLPMVYTLDNSTPTEKSTIIPSKLVINNSCTLKVATLLSFGKLSNVRIINIEKGELNKAIGKKLNSKVRLRIADGLFSNDKDYQSAIFTKDTLLSSLSSYGNKMYDFRKPSLAVYEGEFFIPKTDVYTFSSNVDELWIAGKRLIYNPTSSRFYAKKVEMYLEEGVHKFKIVFSNRLKEGFASCWNPIDFKFVSSTGKEYVYQ